MKRRRTLYKSRELKNGLDQLSKNWGKIYKTKNNITLAVLYPYNMHLYVALIRNVTKSKPICLFFYLLVRKGSRKKILMDGPLSGGRGVKGKGNKFVKISFWLF